MFSFYTPWKHQKTFVFRGYKMGTLALNSLTYAVRGKMGQRDKAKKSSKTGKDHFDEKQNFCKNTCVRI